MVASIPALASVSQYPLWYNAAGRCSSGGCDLASSVKTTALSHFGAQELDAGCKTGSGRGLGFQKDSCTLDALAGLLFLNLFHAVILTVGTAGPTASHKSAPGEGKSHPKLAMTKMVPQGHKQKARNHAAKSLKFKGLESRSESQKALVAGYLAPPEDALQSV